MFWRLWILPVLICATEWPRLGYDKTIHLNRCYDPNKQKLGTICATSATGAGLLVDQHKLTTQGYQAALQIKVFTDRKWLVLLEIRGAAPAAGITLEWELPLASGQTTPDFYTMTITEENIDFGDRFSGSFVNGGQEFSKQRIFVAFYMKSKAQTMKEELQSLTWPMVITYTTAADARMQMTYDMEFSQTWNPDQLIACDPDQIQSVSRPVDGYMHMRLDPTVLLHYHCPEGDLVVKLPSKEWKIVDRVECDLSVANSPAWTYYKDSEEARLGQKDLMALNCKTDKRVCPCAPLKTVSCSTCKTPIEEIKEDGCVTTYRCPNNKWMLEGNIKVDAPHVSCREHPLSNDATRKGWIMNTDLVDAASCRKDYETCWEESKLTLEYCETGANCVHPIRTKHEIICKRATKMKYMQGGETHITPSNKLACDMTTRTFKDSNGKVVPDDSRIFCIKESETWPEIAPLRETLPTTPFYSASLTIACLLAFTTCFAFLLSTRKRNRHFKEDLATRKAYERYLVMRRKRKRKDITSIFDNQANITDVIGIMRTNPIAWKNRQEKYVEVEPNLNALRRWDEIEFKELVLAFPSMSLQYRRQFLFALSALNAYSPEAEKADTSLVSFGNIKQLIYFVNYIRSICYGCLYTWEFVFRIFRLIDGNLATIKKPKRDFRRRLKTILSDFARPVLQELGWTMKPGEKQSDSDFRLLVIRILLWADTPTVMAELKRQTDLPIDEVDTSVRPAVLQFAVRHLNKGPDMRLYMWKLIIENPTWEQGDKNGTLRQHLLYAMCTHYGKKGSPNEFKIMQDTLNALFEEKKKPFSPADIYWAYKGATEYSTNVGEAVDIFTKTIPQDPNPFFENQLKTRFKSTTEIEKIRPKWKVILSDLSTLIIEMCQSEKKYKAIYESITGLENYCVNEDKGMLEAGRLEQRAINIPSLFADTTVTMDILCDIFERRFKVNVARNIRFAEEER